MPTRAKVFSLEEANALIPQIESLLTSYETQHQIFQSLEEHLFFDELLGQTNPHEDEIKTLEENLTKLEVEIQKIQQLGCLLRHPEKGWVDFLARPGKEWICYCWCRGEEKIQFFHTLRGGFLDRKPLPDTVGPSCNARTP